MDNWHNKDAADVISSLESDLKNGLSGKEATKRLARYGKNTLREAKKESFIKKFLNQFKDFMIITLLIAAAISLFVAIYEKQNDFAEPVIILAIVFINAFIGTLQEAKAARAIASLKNLITPTGIVLRNGKVSQIEAANLVPGDIIYLRTGETIPADARLLEAYSLSCDESALTGESLPSEKQVKKLAGGTPLAERTNMVYSGTVVANGHGIAIVAATGMNTQVGQIADLIHQGTAPLTPLQKNLEKTGKLLGTAALFICIILFFIGILQKQDILFMFMTSISLAVAAIPEGLPAIVTILLSMGVLRLAKKNTIIRNLPAVETLGSATVICSDKTGTLTQNEMHVRDCFLPAMALSSSEDTLKHAKKQLAKCCLLCSNTIYDAKKDTYIGEATENALYAYALQEEPSCSKILAAMPKIKELPFSGTTKRMTTLHQEHSGYFLITKGAPERILALCSTYYDGTKAVPLTDKMRRKIEKANLHMAGLAYRTIAFACQSYQKNPGNLEMANHNLTYVGLAGMMDPPRKEAKEAIHICRQAHINTIMITGDQPLTARAIAEQIGLPADDSSVCTGKELDAMSDDMLAKAIRHIHIFARVEPRHKVRIVRALQQHGHVVAMTGDGINDAPALKAADIGCAMGKSGTDAARSAADLLLLDDNFATIVLAVKEGRGIFLNIKRTIHFLLSCNIGEILTIFLAILMTAKSPLLPIHLLWINLITDSFPALALGMEPAPKDIMHTPVKKQHALLDTAGILKIVTEGCMIGLLSLLAYTIGTHAYLGARTSAAVTMCFCVLCFSQLVHALNLRSEHSLFRISPFSNFYLLGAFICCSLAQFAIIFFPQLAAYFQTTLLSAREWLIVIILSLQPLIIMELQKFTLHLSSK